MVGSLTLISYETYHIGSKLAPAVQADILIDALRKELGTKGFEVPKTSGLDLPVKIGLPVEPIAAKDDVRVEVNLPSHALNCVGRVPAKVSVVFGNLMDRLPAVGFELKASIVLFEVVASPIYETARPPSELLKSVLELDPSHLESIGSIGVLEPATIQLSTKEADSEESISVVLEKHPTSPTTRLRARIRFVTRDASSAKDFHTRMEPKLASLIESMAAK